MKSFETSIRRKHIELIQTFFEANNFEDARILSYIDMDNYGTQEMIRIFYSDDDEIAITFMALRHAGVQNMLDHYLMKCGVPAFDLHATKILNMKEAMEIALANKK